MRQVPPTSQVRPPRCLHSEPRVSLLKQVFGAHYSQASSATGEGGRRPRDTHLTTRGSVTTLPGSPGMPGCGDHHRLGECSTGPPWCQKRAHSWECWHLTRRGGSRFLPCGPGQGPGPTWPTAVRPDGLFPWSGRALGALVFLHPESSPCPSQLAAALRLGRNRHPRAPAPPARRLQGCGLPSRGLGFLICPMGTISLGRMSF